jgi:hypothetical protein
MLGAIAKIGRCSERFIAQNIDFAEEGGRLPIRSVWLVLNLAIENAPWCIPLLCVIPRGQGSVTDSAGDVAIDSNSEIVRRILKVENGI